MSTGSESTCGCQRCHALARVLEALIVRYLGDAGDASYQACPELETVREILVSPCSPRPPMATIKDKGGNAKAYGAR